MTVAIYSRLIEVHRLAEQVRFKLNGISEDAEGRVLMELNGIGQSIDDVIGKVIGAKLAAKEELHTPPRRPAA